MKKITTVLFAVAGFILASQVFAQANSASANANANARIVPTITLAKSADLNFGDVVAGASLGTVVMTSASARSATGGTTLGNANGAAAAGFNVGGQASATYAITLPGAASTISDGGGHTMTVDTWTGSKATGTLSGAGADTFTVGATLHVGANQVAGTYTGTFSVTVAYN